MYYFNDLFTMFLSLDRGSSLAVYGRLREPSELIQNIVICVSKINECLTSLEWHEGE